MDNSSFKENWKNVQKPYTYTFLMSEIKDYVKEIAIPGLGRPSLQLFHQVTYFL